jgi:hypothetical protein
MQTQKRSEQTLASALIPIQMSILDPILDPIVDPIIEAIILPSLLPEVWFLILFYCLDFIPLSSVKFCSKSTRFRQSNENVFKLALILNVKNCLSPQGSAFFTSHNGQDNNDGIMLTKSMTLLFCNEGKESIDNLVNLFRPKDLLQALTLYFSSQTSQVHSSSLFVHIIEMMGEKKVKIDTFIWCNLTQSASLYTLQKALPNICKFYPERRLFWIFTIIEKMFKENELLRLAPFIEKQTIFLKTINQHKLNQMIYSLIKHLEEHDIQNIDIQNIDLILAWFHDDDKQELFNCSAWSSSLIRHLITKYGDACIASFFMAYHVAYYRLNGEQDQKQNKKRYRLESLRFLWTLQNFPRAQVLHWLLKGTRSIRDWYNIDYHIDEKYDDDYSIERSYLEQYRTFARKMEILISLFRPCDIPELLTAVTDDDTDIRKRIAAIK